MFYHIGQKPLIYVLILLLSCPKTNIELHPNPNPAMSQNAFDLHVKQTSIQSEGTYNTYG